MEKHDFNQIFEVIYKLLWFSAFLYSSIAVLSLLYISFWVVWFSFDPEVLLTGFLSCLAIQAVMIWYTKELIFGYSPKEKKRTAVEIISISLVAFGAVATNFDKVVSY